MKKKYIVLSLIVATVFSACTEKQYMEFSPIDDSVYTLVMTDFKALAFSDTTYLWNEGDAIGVYGSECGYNERYVIKSAGVGKSQAFFYGPAVKGKIAAYYPYNPSYIADADAMYFTLGTEQVYEEDPVELYSRYKDIAFANMDENGTMDFYYPNALLGITFEFPEAVTVTDLKVESKTTGLSGMGFIHPDGTTTAAESAKKYVSLDCGQEGISTVADGQSLTTFYLVIMPGIYDDLKVIINIKEKDFPIMWNLPKVELKKANASDFQALTVNFKPGSGPAGFDEITVPVFDK